MQHLGGLRWLMFLCGPWLCPMLSSFETTHQTQILGYCCSRFSWASSQKFCSISSNMFGDVQCMCCTPHFRIERNHLNGNLIPKEMYLLAMLLSFHGMWVWSFTLEQDSSHLSFMFVMMIGLQQSIQMSPLLPQIGRTCSLTALKGSVTMIGEPHFWMIIGFLEKKEQTRDSGKLKNGQFEMHGERGSRKRIKVKRSTTSSTKGCNKEPQGSNTRSFERFF